MKGNNSNYIFNPSKWKEIREKGFLRFVIMPVIIMLLASAYMSYYSFDITKGNILNASILTIIIGVIIFLSRITTWYWKEYKYKRHINNITTFKRTDYIIGAANLIRIIVNIAIILVVLHFYIQGSKL